MSSIYNTTYSERSVLDSQESPKSEKSTENFSKSATESIAKEALSKLNQEVPQTSKTFIHSVSYIEKQESEAVNNFIEETITFLQKKAGYETQVSRLERFSKNSLKLDFMTHLENSSPLKKEFSEILSDLKKEDLEDLEKSLSTQANSKLIHDIFQLSYATQDILEKLSQPKLDKENLQVLLDYILSNYSENIGNHTGILSNVILDQIAKITSTFASGQVFIFAMLFDKIIEIANLDHTVIDKTINEILYKRYPNLEKQRISIHHAFLKLADKFGYKSTLGLIKSLSLLDNNLADCAVYGIFQASCLKKDNENEKAIKEAIEIINLKVTEGLKTDDLEDLLICIEKANGDASILQENLRNSQKHKFFTNHSQRLIAIHQAYKKAKE
ncbi:MAG: hypothetical protein K0S74_811 [Chlamydiales bacterium]|jgi:hypothetical protein|nr:hypothetical protein [Chlamydiales bacterium]